MQCRTLEGKEEKVYREYGELEDFLLSIKSTERFKS